MSIRPVANARGDPANCGSASGVSNGFCVIPTSQSRSCLRLNAGSSAQIRAKRLRDAHASVLLLELFEDRDERAPDRQTRSVQRVHQRRLRLFVFAEADL